MSCPVKKAKKESSAEPEWANPSLPNDLLVSCFARASRLYYPTLSLVSKSFESLIASPELYKTRSLLNNTETCLYVCLKFPPDPNPHWFTLCRKPNITNESSTKKNKKSSGYVLATVWKTPQSPLVFGSSYVSVGSSIYKLGGASKGSPLSCVSILDCQSHTWREAPCMRVERYQPAANVVDGKIYVAGGNNKSDWMEVFDTETGVWEVVWSPDKSRVIKSAVIHDEIYMFWPGAVGEGVTYKPKEGKWKEISDMMCFDDGWYWTSCCLIDNVLYSYDNEHGIRWYDHSKVGRWKVLLGLNGLPKFADYSRVKLVEYGEKLVVLWDKYLPSSGYKNKMIWCAVIALERHDVRVMWGEVESLDAVLTVPKTYEFVCALSASV